MPGLTVLIATYNRADVLRQTLSALNSVDRTGIDCDIVIIDNNSTDNTAEVVKEYSERLPLSLLRETRPGKNCALNKALRECTLRGVVVFTDDDITPAKDWFQQIVSSTRRWPGIEVFGGKIDIEWPDNKQPEWVVAEWVRIIGFSPHDYGNSEIPYESPQCPFGANCWVRKTVFEKVSQFDETIGPRPSNRIMGSETSFFRELQSHGVPMLYYPKSEVRHRVRGQECLIPALRRRGYRFGRGQVRLHGWYRYNVYLKSKTLWCITLAADYLYTALRFLIGCVVKDSKRNCEITVNSMIRFGQLRETINQIWGHFRWNHRIPVADCSRRTLS